MRIRPSTRELCYTLAEFRKLDGGEICRRYSWGDWLDYWKDSQAAKEMREAQGT